MSPPVGRYVPVFFLRNEDDRRRYFVVDLAPSDTAKTGTVIAEVHGEGLATQIAAALNRQPPTDLTPEARPRNEPHLLEKGGKEPPNPPPAPTGQADPPPAPPGPSVSPYVQPFLHPLATVPDADGPDGF